MKLLGSRIRCILDDFGGFLSGNLSPQELERYLSTENRAELISRIPDQVTIGNAFYEGEIELDKEERLVASFRVEKLNGADFSHISLEMDLKKKDEGIESIEDNPYKDKISLENLQLAVDHSSSVLSIYNDAGKPLFISRSCLKILGYSPEEIANHQPFQGIHPKDINGYKVYLQRCFEERIDEEYEFRFIRKNGKEIWLSNYTRYIPNPEGSGYLIHSLSWDITEEKELRDKLIHSKLQADAILNSSKSAIYLLNKDWKLINLNDRAMFLSSKLFKNPVAKGDQIQSAIQESEIRALSSRIMRAFQGNDSEFYQEFENRNGSIWYKGQVTPVWDTNGQIDGATLEFIDVTEEKQSEKFTLDLLERISLATHGSALGIFEYSVDHQQFQFDDQSILLFHRNVRVRENIETITKLAAKGEEKRIRNFFSKLIRTKKSSFDEVFKFKFPEEGTRYLHLKGKIHRNSFGETDKLLGVCIDVSNQYKLQAKLEKQNTLLREKNRRIEEYSFANSHKVRAPLANIIGLISVLKMNYSEEILEMLEQSVNELDAVIHELNDVLTES